MSRTGKKPIPLPEGVEITQKGDIVKVAGPKGILSQELTGGISVSVDAGKRELIVARAGDSRSDRALHGLYRALLANMVGGVVTPYEKRLEIKGVGYNAKLQGRELVLNIGFCHPVRVSIPVDLEIETPRPTVIVVRGPDKQKVGQLAAEIRRIRPPEPYNEKGIKYDGEVIRRKAGKTFVSGAT